MAADRKRRPSTIRVAVFVREYLKHFNSAQAARRAGAPPAGAKERGYQLLQHPDVKAAIERKQAELRSMLDLDLEDVVRDLHRIAFGTESADALSGHPLLTGRIPAELRHAISEATRTPKGRITIRLSDKVSALIALGRCVGLDATASEDRTAPERT